MVADFVALVVGGWHGCMALVVVVLVVVVMDCVSGRCKESGYDLPPREWVVVSVRERVMLISCGTDVVNVTDGCGYVLTCMPWEPPLHWWWWWWW